MKDKRKYAMRHKGSGEIPGPWYSSPRIARRSFTIWPGTCGLPALEYAVVDNGPLRSSFSEAGVDADLDLGLALLMEAQHGDA